MERPPSSPQRSYPAQLEKLTKETCPCIALRPVAPQPATCFLSPAHPAVPPTRCIGRATPAQRRAHGTPPRRARRLAPAGARPPRARPSCSPSRASDPLWRALPCASCCPVALPPVQAPAMRFPLPVGECPCPRRSRRTVVRVGTRSPPLSTSIFPPAAAMGVWGGCFVSRRDAVGCGESLFVCELRGASVHTAH